MDCKAIPIKVQRIKYETVDLDNSKDLREKQETQNKYLSEAS